MSRYFAESCAPLPLFLFGLERPIRALRVGRKRARATPSCRGTSCISYRFRRGKDRYALLLLPYGPAWAARRRPRLPPATAFPAAGGAGGVRALALRLRGGPVEPEIGSVRS